MFCHCRRGDRSSYKYYANKYVRTTNHAKLDLPLKSWWSTHINKLLASLFIVAGATF